MATTTDNSTTPVPVVSTTLPRMLAKYVVTANLFFIAIAALVILGLHRSEYWLALEASILVAATSVIASVTILGKAAGKSVDWLVTFVMGAAVIRVGVSLIGLIAAILVFGSPAMSTVILVCSYFFVTLVVETSLLARSLRRLSDVGGTHV